MQTLPSIPTTPESFARLMETIWADHCEPAADGGITLYTTVWYDDWHDAIKVAERIGLRRTGGSVRNGQHGHIYRFENGDGVFIHVDGSGVDPHCNRFGKRKR